MRHVNFLFGLAILVSFVANSSWAFPKKISNEAAAHQAVLEFSKYNDMRSIYQTLIRDSGRALRVDVKWKDGATKCVSSHWISYDGHATACDACQDKTNCQCLATVCDQGADENSNFNLNINSKSAPGPS